MHKPESFGLQCRSEQAHAGDIASRSTEAHDDADLDRIGGADEDDRDCGGCRFCNFCGVATAGGQDHGNFTFDQIGHQARQPGILTFPARYSITTFWPSW